MLRTRECILYTVCVLLQLGRLHAPSGTAETLPGGPADPGKPEGPGTPVAPGWPTNPGAPGGPRAP